MLIWLTGAKIFLYTLVFIRAFQHPPISLSLALIALALLVSGFWRNWYRYARTKVNIITLLLDLVLAALFSFLTNSSSFDKLFIIYLIEGTAILPKPLFWAYAGLTTAAGAGAMALYYLRVEGKLQFPGIAELLLYVFIIILVLSERKQREQRLAYEKLTRELSYVNRQLKESMAWNESLASETERRRIAGEIHDSLGHDLTGLILTLEAGKKLSISDREAGKAYWDKALQVSRSALESVRELVTAKNEANLEFELIPRLREMVRDIESVTGLSIDLDVRNGNFALTRQEQFQIYRIFQEAFTNTLRHAKADRAQISISGNKELFHFVYWDNGIGTDRIKAGNGLKGMKDRIAALHGDISWQSRTGMGFKIAGYIDRRGKEE